jgi:hypothetical protein
MWEWLPHFTHWEEYATSIDFLKPYIYKMFLKIFLYLFEYAVCSLPGPVSSSFLPILFC